MIVLCTTYAHKPIDVMGKACGDTIAVYPTECRDASIAGIRRQCCQTSTTYCIRANHLELGRHGVDGTNGKRTVLTLVIPRLGLSMSMVCY